MNGFFSDARKIFPTTDVFSHNTLDTPPDPYIYILSFSNIPDSCLLLNIKKF